MTDAPTLTQAQHAAHELAIDAASLAGRLVRLELALPADTTSYPIYGLSALKQVASMRALLTDIEAAVLAAAERRGQLAEVQPEPEAAT